MVTTILVTSLNAHVVLALPRIRKIKHNALVETELLSMLISRSVRPLGFFYRWGISRKALAEFGDIGPTK
jgi:hypothetical protein